MGITGAVSDALAVLLGIAGGAKLVRPAGVTAALDRLHPPGWNAIGQWPVARLLGLVEIVVAVGAVATGGRVWAAALTVCYAAFSVVVWRLAAGPATDCGCFGAASGTVNRTHVTVDVVFTVAAAICVAYPSAGLAQGWGPPGPALANVMVVGLLVAVGYLAFTALPQLVAARRQVATPPVAAR
jgi:hypothetical protein